MERRGAVFFLYSRSKAGWYRIDRRRRALIPFDVARIGTVFGSKPNCIEDEPALAELASGDADGSVEVFLAKPLAMETRIQSVIRKALQTRGIAISNVTGVKGVYDLMNGRFSLLVTGIGTRDRGYQPLRLTILL